MGDYLIVAEASEDPGAKGLSEALMRAAMQSGYHITTLNARAWLGVRGPSPPRLVNIGGWFLVGDVFDRHSPSLPETARGDMWAYERKLAARIWGRYVGVLFGSKNKPIAVLRDPSGAMECVTWSQDDLTLVCSAADDWLIEHLRPKWRINPHRLSQALHSLVAGTGPLILDGPVALEPGTVQPLPATTPPTTIWMPCDIARRSLGPPPPLDEAMDRVRTAVDEAVAGLGGLPGPLAADVSGGLDSSIVAASLKIAGVADVRLWLNAYGPTPESDERNYARILGEALGFKPQFVPHADEPIGQPWLDALAGGFRPGLNALDFPQDRLWAKWISASGAEALVTGKGGDSIFFQAATTDVFTDMWLSTGWRALGHPDLTELAAINEISTWTMVSNALRYRQGENGTLLRDHPMFSQSDSPPPHPWLKNLGDFGPGKAFQIAGVADGVSHHGASTLSRSIDIRHPLCAQPVVEACLALPTPLLTVGGRDRGLVRRAFRDRLPHEIVDRRTKGEMTRVYGRMIAANLNVLRPWLAEGRLAALGLIDREAALTELTPERLIWCGQHAAILTAAALEAWVRLWERRLA